MKIKNRIPGIILSVVSALLTIGVQTFFSACGPKEDGSWMTCHWSQQAVFAMGIVLTLISLITAVVNDDKIRLGAALSLIPLSLVTAFVPGNFIGLCMMESMHCHTVMKPAVLVAGIVIAVLSAAYSVILIRKTASVMQSEKQK